MMLPLRSLGAGARWRAVALGVWVLFLLGLIALADSGHGGRLFALAELIPAGDKVGHFLLFGTLSFLANLVTRSARIRWRGWALRKASVFLLAAITLEECSQVFFRSRTFDLRDLGAGALGVWWFGWLAEKLMRKDGAVERGRKPPGEVKSSTSGARP